MSVSIELIKRLREETGAGVLETKKTLEEAGGDYDRAAEILREKGLAKVAKKADREAKEGLVELYSHPGNRIGVILEINCETDFVARNERFKTLAHDIALHIAAMEPIYIDRKSVPQAICDEKIAEFRAEAIAEGKPENIVTKIVDGKLNKFYSEVCLLEQDFVKDEEVKVLELINGAIGVLGENIIVRRFNRYSLGEELPETN
ncbi:MAG: translation elongation factor Ts [Anaerolineae bacterium]|nr:MAG: translation elongation factor Ts [Anaerolineae bacterium]